MAQRGFPVLVATDGSPQARAAVELAAEFPWPRGSRGHGIVAHSLPALTAASPDVWEALLEAGRAEARRAEERLRRRWPRAEVIVVDAPPVVGILRQARKLRARAIVLGSRGLGAVGRLLLGGVSRAIVRQASSSVLVVRGPARKPRRLVVGIDGSPHARRALALVAGLTPPRGGQVRLLSVVEAVRVPSAALMPARVRGAVAREAAELERERIAQARRPLEVAQTRLERGGWRVRVDVRAGQPLEELLAVATDADVLVVGARGVGGVERLVVGSVAEGAVSRAPVPVLVVR
ncbi:MAG TPA: universal stress protein [Methylomirabilota bacterium]|jgi:nucleotide-binding universal stress UspA family protein|nr:universal stress protein [Methylomirabilota bacterium]